MTRNTICNSSINQLLTVNQLRRVALRPHHTNILLSCNSEIPTTMWHHSTTACTTGTLKVPAPVWSPFIPQLAQLMHTIQIQCGLVPPKHTQLASYGLELSHSITGHIEYHFHKSEKLELQSSTLQCSTQITIHGIAEVVDKPCSQNQISVRFSMIIIMKKIPCALKSKNKLQLINSQFKVCESNEQQRL